MRNLTLHGLLRQFTIDAGARLDLAAGKEEIPFEVAAAGGRVPLYCYRPLTGDFIRRRLGLLRAVASYAPAAQSLAGIGGTEAYLRARGIKRIPAGPRTQADEALYNFLARVFDQRSEFALDEARFESAYGELERSIYQGRCVTEVVAPLLGIDFDPETEEVALGEGLSILRANALAAAPAEIVRTRPTGLLLVLRVAHDSHERPSIAFAHTRFARVLTALRLYERGHYALGPIAHSRIDDGPWDPSALELGGRLSEAITVIPGSREDELRAFCSLIGRRLARTGAEQSGAGEVAWALRRFELACERPSRFEALSDHLLALRALLEPEGAASGRLPQRLAVICAAPVDRAALAARAARAAALERAVITGRVSRSDDSEALMDELAEHLRAILRDVLCGHLDADVRGLADELLQEELAAEAVV